MRLPPFNPYIAVVIGIIAVSTTAVLVKSASHAPTAIIANYRLLFAVILMLPLIFFKYRHEFSFMHKKDWFLSILAGIVLAAHFIIWFESLNYTSVASSVVLITLQPVFVFIGTYLFFKERFSAGAIISMIIALFGSLIILWGDFQNGPFIFWGDLLALLGLVSLTASILLGQKVRMNLSFITYTFVVYSIGTVTLFIYNIVMQHSFLSYSSSHWAIFLALAIVPTFLGQYLFNWAFKWLNALTISMGTIFKPVGATILAYFFLGEIVNSTQLLGGTIIIFGLFLFILSTAKKRKVTISHHK